MTPQLKQILEAGSVEALFPLLKDWSQEELRAVLVDLAAYEQEEASRIRSVWKSEVLKPGAFFDQQLSKALDGSMVTAIGELSAICSEIYSVVYYYLQEEPPIETAATE